MDEKKTHLSTHIVHTMYITKLLWALVYGLSNKNKTNCTINHKIPNYLTKP